MGRNYIAEIAKLYGLKLNEVFRLSGCVGTYFKFVDEGLVRSNYGDIWRTEPQDLVDILTGNYRVVRIAPKPLYGSTYFVASPANINMYETFSWRDTIEDKEYYKRGLVFSTATEAVEASRDVFDMLSNTAFARQVDGNYMEEVAELLGVNLNKPFQFKDENFEARFKFTLSGLYCYSPTIGDWVSVPAFLLNFVTGIFTLGTKGDCKNG